MKPKSPVLSLLYLWLLLCAMLPLLMIFIYSFLSPNSQTLVGLPFTLANFSIFFDPLYLKVFSRSIGIAMLTTVCCLILAFPFSYCMIRAKHQSLILLLIIVPFWTSSLVRTYALVAILKAKGLINKVLLSCHLIDKPLDLLYNNIAVLIGLVYNLLPFMILPLYTNMERFDFPLLEAAKDLGASRWQSFWKVFVPANAQGIISGCILVILPSMTLFYIPNILGGARSVLLGNLIQDQFLVNQHWPEGAATSAIFTGVLLLSFVFLKRWMREAP